MSQTLESKFFSAKSVGVATFLGGPLAAGMMIRKNFLGFGQPKQAQQALWAGIGLTLAVFSLIALVPSGLMEKVPGALIPGAYTAGILAWVNAQMGERLTVHENEGGQFYSGWKTFGVGLLSLIATAVIGFGILMMAPAGSSETAYQQNFQRIAANETKANEFYTLVEKEDTTPEQLLKFLDGTVIPAWNDSAEAVKEMKTLTWLDASTVKQRAAVEQYVSLQQERVALTRRVLTEDESDAVTRLQAINKQLESFDLSAK